MRNDFSIIWRLARRVLCLFPLGLILVGALAARADDAPASLPPASADEVSAGSDEVPWSEFRALDLDKVFKSRYASTSNLFNPALSPSSHALALRDADNRMAPSFRVPYAMRDSVSFWLRIYTEYSTRHYVIFDRHHPDVIYEVMDFQDLFQASRNRVAYEIVREQRIKKRIAEYRAAFARLARLKKKAVIGAKGVGELERKILSTVARSDHKHPMALWSRNLRGQTGQRDNVVKGLLAAETFFPKMEEIFTSLDIPKELTRLPLVESSFNIQAHSKAGAVGVWQFMPLSGKEYLRVDPTIGIDERRSPLKSTVAAARLLKRNLVVTGNWPLAITAYNHGFTAIRRLSPKQRASALDGTLFRLCQKSHRLGFASSNYFAEFLAILHAEAYKDLFYADSPLPVAPPLAFERVDRALTPVQWMKTKSMSIQDFQLYNPDVRSLYRKMPVGLYLAAPAPKDEVASLVGSINVKMKRVKAKAPPKKKAKPRLAVR